jgi:hypothetical protein
MATSLRPLTIRDAPHGGEREFENEYGHEFYEDEVGFHGGYRYLIGVGPVAARTPTPSCYWTFRADPRMEYSTGSFALHVSPPSEPDDIVASLPDVLTEDEFQELVEEWRADTRFLSSVSDKVIHPAYQRIMANGPSSLPMILSDMRREPDHWFWALYFIVGRDVAEGTETIEAATAAWTKWGEERGYL